MNLALSSSVDSKEVLERIASILEDGFDRLTGSDTSVTGIPVGGGRGVFVDVGVIT